MESVVTICAAGNLADGLITVVLPKHESVLVERYGARSKSFVVRRRNLSVWDCNAGQLAGLCVIAELYELFACFEVVH
jgi:hypothetical protein